MTNNLPFVCSSFHTCSCNIPWTSRRADVAAGLAGGRCGRKSDPHISEHWCLLQHPPNPICIQVVKIGQGEHQKSVSGEETSKKGNTVSWGWAGLMRSPEVGLPVLLLSDPSSEPPPPFQAVSPGCTAQEPPQSQHLGARFPSALFFS